MFLQLLELSKKVIAITLPQIITNLKICHVAFLYIFFNNTWLQRVQITNMHLIGVASKKVQTEQFM